MKAFHILLIALGITATSSAFAQDSYETFRCQVDRIDYENEAQLGRFEVITAESMLVHRHYREAGLHAFCSVSSNGPENFQALTCNIARAGCLTVAASAIPTDGNYLKVVSQACEDSSTYEIVCTR